MNMVCQHIFASAAVAVNQDGHAGFRNLIDLLPDGLHPLRPPKDQLFGREVLGSASGNELVCVSQDC